MYRRLSDVRFQDVTSITVHCTHVQISNLRLLDHVHCHIHRNRHRLFRPNSSVLRKLCTSSFLITPSDHQFLFVAIVATFFILVVTCNPSPCATAFSLNSMIQFPAHVLRCIHVYIKVVDFRLSIPFRIRNTKCAKCLGLLQTSYLSV